MEQEYRLSKETATYIDAVRKLNEACSLVLHTVEDIYGNLNAPTGDDIVKAFMEAYNKTVDELFKLIQENTCVNLGFKDNTCNSIVRI